MRTQAAPDHLHNPVAIVGAGPAGLMLSHLLHLQGVESVVLEKQSRSEVESTVRAGILEQGTIDLLRKTGVGERLDREAEIDEAFQFLLLEKVIASILPSTPANKSLSIHSMKFSLILLPNA